jgi:hypothetical protein
VRRGQSDPRDCGRVGATSPPTIFDNIPLTALALKQGGYDWGFLACAVGFGGSMIWLGSSEGVAISNLLPEGRSVGCWLVAGWHVVAADVALLVRAARHE